MRYITREYHIEMIPESEEDVEYLKKEYPHLWPFKSVCLPVKKEYQPSFKPRLTGALT